MRTEMETELEQLQKEAKKKAKLLAKAKAEERKKQAEEHRRRQVERKRRTRALILFATGLIRELSFAELEEQIRLISRKGYLRAMDRGEEVNFENYLCKEIEAIRKEKH